MAWSEIQQASYHFRLLADPTRLRLLRTLCDGRWRCVSDLLAAMQLPRQKLLREVEHLRRSGLIWVRKDGQLNYYGVAPVKTPFQQGLLQLLSTSLSECPAPPGCASSLPQPLVRRPGPGRPRTRGY